MIGIVDAKRTTFNEPETNLNLKSYDCQCRYCLLNKLTLQVPEFSNFEFHFNVQKPYI